MRDPVRPNIKLAATIRFLSTGANYAMPVINRSVLSNMFVSCGEFEFQLDRWLEVFGSFDLVQMEP